MNDGYWLGCKKRFFLTGVQRMRNRSFLTATSGCLALSLLGGCVSGSPPRTFQVNNSYVTPLTGPTKVDISGIPGGKAVGAGVGAGAGAGYGAAAGSLACLAAGPFAPLCFITVLPTTMAVGAVSGAVVGGARTETAEAMKAKAKTLSTELSSADYNVVLANQLLGQLREARGKTVGWRNPGEPSSDDSAPWMVEAGVVELGTDGNSPFALTLRAVMRVSRVEPKFLWETSLLVQSETEVTIDQWQADNSTALRAVISECIGHVAVGLATVLAGPLPNDPQKGMVRTSDSCNDEPKKWTPEKAASAPPRK